MLLELKERADDFIQFECPVSNLSRLALGELSRFTRSGGCFGTFWKPERFCLMNSTAIETRLFCFDKYQISPWKISRKIRRNLAPKSKKLDKIRPNDPKVPKKPGPFQEIGAKIAEKRPIFP